MECSTLFDCNYCFCYLMLVNLPANWVNYFFSETRYHIKSHVCRPARRIHFAIQSAVSSIRHLLLLSTALTMKYTHWRRLIFDSVAISRIRDFICLSMYVRSFRSNLNFRHFYIPPDVYIKLGNFMRNFHSSPPQQRRQPPTTM